MANAVKTYNGGNAFTLMPNGMDSRTVNKLLYTPNAMNQQDLYASYDFCHPKCYSGSGTVVNDLTANGFDMTLDGGVESTYDPVTGSFDQDGVNDVIDTVSTVTWPSDEYAACAWIKTGGNLSGINPLMGVISPSLEGWILYTSGTEIVWRVSVGGGIRVIQEPYTSTPLSLNTWYFFAMSYNPTLNQIFGEIYDSSGNIYSGYSLTGGTLSPSSASNKYITLGSTTFPSNYAYAESYFFDGQKMSSEFGRIYFNTKARYGY